MAIVLLIFVVFGGETTAVVFCGFVVVSFLLSGCFCVVGLVTSAFFVVCVESASFVVSEVDAIILGNVFPIAIILSQSLQ